MRAFALIILLVLSLSAVSCIGDLSPDEIHLNDFENKGDLFRIEWDCHTWFELSREHAVSGTYSLKADLPPGRYPGITFSELPARNWSRYDFLSVFVYYEGTEDTTLIMRVDDEGYSDDYGQRANLNYRISPGPNRIKVSMDAIRENPSKRRLDTEHISQVILFLYNTQRREILYFDDFKLLKKKRWP